MGNSNSNNKIILLSEKLKKMKLVLDKGDYTIYEQIDKQKLYEYWVWKSESDNFEEAELAAQDLKQIQSITKIYYQSRGCILETFKNEYIFALIMEHPLYNLKDYLNRKKILYKNQIINMVTGILGAQCALKNGCQYLGFNNIYTNDGDIWMLKPFQKIRSFSTDPNQLDGYPAPEEFNQIEYNVEKATVFSFGMLILQLILDKSNKHVYRGQSIDIDQLNNKIQELQQKKIQFELDFLRIIVQMLTIDPEQRPDYFQLLNLLNEKNVGLSNQQKLNLSQILFKSSFNQNSRIMQDVVSVPLVKEQYLIKLFDYEKQIEKIEEDDQEQLASHKEKEYSIIHYNNYTILDQAYDYHDFTNVMFYATKYEGHIQNQQKNGSGTLYLSNNEIFQGEFRNDMIEGEGQFQTIDKHIVRGVWKSSILQQKKSISKAKSIFQQKENRSYNSKLQIQHLDDSSNIAEELVDIQKKPIGEISTLSNPQKLYNYQNKSLNNYQINYHSNYDENNRRKGYISDEQGMIIYTGLFCNENYDGYGVLYNLNYSKVNIVNYLDINEILNQNAWVKYDGEFRNGKKNGYGKLYFSDKGCYQGYFINDQINGEGQFTNSKKEIINGLWIDGIYQQPSR